MVCGPDIDGDLAVGNALDHFVRRAGLDLGDHHVIDGEEELVAEFGEELFGEFDLVFLDERFAGGQALRAQEGVGHGAADEQAVDHLAQVLDDFDFVGDLGAAEDGDAGARRIGGGHAEILQFLLHEQSGGGLLDELDHALGGSVGAVGGAEGVVDVDVAEGGEFLGEGGIVLFLLGVEAQILEEEDFAGGGLHGFDFGADAIGRHFDGAAEQLLPAARLRAVDSFPDSASLWDGRGATPESRRRRGRGRIEWWAATP